MKKWIALLLGCAAMLGIYLYTAKQTNQPERVGYDLYFLERDLDAVAGEGALQTERVFLPEGEEQAGRQQMAEWLLGKLLEGPQNPELKSAIPTGTTLQSVTFQGIQATVDLSAHYQSLSGISLTLADYAIAMTLTQLPGIMSVIITVRGRELAYRDRQIFKERDVLLKPEGDILGAVTADLYFLTEYETLQKEERTLDLYEGDTQVMAVIRAIEQGPQDNQLSAVWPEGFRIRTAWQEDGVCYVNLPSALLSSLPEQARLEQTLQSIGKSLCSLIAVGEVRFLVDGEFAETYGSVDISESYTR